MINIKKIALTLCLLMTVCFSIHSQDTSKILITSDQLRTANLIFAEHKEYSKLVPLLRQENTNLQTINQTWIVTDSIKTEQIYRKNQIIDQQNANIEKLERQIKNATTVYSTIAGVSIIVTIVCLLVN